VEPAPVSIERGRRILPEARQISPEEIRRLRELNPEMRERDFARIQKISEAELVAAFVGAGSVRLRPDVEALLAGAPALGEVMCLTRNEHAVHEKIGVFEKARFGRHASIVLGEEIDLRIFPAHWASAYAVEKLDKDGAVRRSLQFFDAAGTAVHKVHCRPATDLGAYQALVETLRAVEQLQTVEIRELDDSEVNAAAAQASAAQLREAWQALTDTHQFFPMLKRLNLSRHQALKTIDREFAWPLAANAAGAMLERAAGSGLPIMAFVGSRGCIQIHSGPIQHVQAMGPWINVMDETFHLHLRADQIQEVWAVRKPTADGHVTSIEAFGADNKLIIQFFGQRQEGVDERAAWRALIEGLPQLDQSTAA
jgi:putative hemin transport protein